MTQDVLLTITGLHDIAELSEEEDAEVLEVIAPARYYRKNGKHYILYEEVVEGIPGVINNRIKISGEQMLEIMKSGITNAHMEGSSFSISSPESSSASFVAATAYWQNASILLAALKSI